MTVARPVAKFTAAVTSSKAESFFSTRAAHAAHVIPWTESSTSCNPGDDAVPVTAADIQPCLPAEPPDRGEYHCTGNLHRVGNAHNEGGRTLT